MDKKKTIKVTLIKSLIGCKQEHRQCVIGLGLTKKIGSSAEVDRNPQNLGMIRHVNYLLKCEGL